LNFIADYYRLKEYFKNSKNLVVIKEDILMADYLS